LPDERNPMDESKKKAKKPGREYGRYPNRFIYGFASFLLNIFLKMIFHVKYHVDPRIKDLPRPLIILGTHPSYLDPFMTGCALYPMKINFLAAANFFRNRRLKPFLYLGGIIPKSQFRADPAAIKSMLRVVNRKGALGIFPEGARSIDGTPLPIEESISKFIKKAGGSVIIGTSQGSYLSWPRWSESGYRRGEIHFDLQLLYTKEEVLSLPVEKIQSGIVAALHFDEYLWQEKARIPFRSKAPAKGLHNVLHQCPACKKRWVTDSTKTTLFCTSCGNTAVMDDFGFLHPRDEQSAIYPTTRDWNEWQIQDMAPSVSLDSFFLEEEADLYISEQDTPYQLAGKGSIRLDRAGFTFHGTFLDKTVERTFQLAGILGISSDYGSNFDVVSDRYTYRFLLKKGQKVISFTHALDLLRKDRSVQSYDPVPNL